MLRFASSPTTDMHIGNLRVALFNYIISQQRKEDLIVRIEDIDKEKNIEGKDTEILDILGVFGISYSQTIYQSESTRFHTAMALQLIHEKKGFSCFCSDEWLDTKREEAKKNKQAYRYDDACANLPAELVIDNLSPFCIRVNQPVKSISIKDYIQGQITFTKEDVDSFIILSQNKTPTYNFACAVDDMLNDISLVIRDASHLSSTPYQEHIRAALKYDKKIEYAHLPTLLNDDIPSVKSLLEEGFLPDAISNYLISLNCETSKDIFTLAESLELVDISKISKSPVLFDMAMLKEVNTQHLMNLSDKELSRYVGFADEEIGQLAKLYLGKLSTTKELKAHIASIFEKKNIPKEVSTNATLIVEAIKAAPYFELYDGFKDHILKKTGLNNDDFLQALRYVLTGTNDCPAIEEVYKYIKNYIGEIVK